MASIRHLPSGKYQVRVMQGGTTYTKTLKYKPTKRELNLIVAEMLDEPRTDQTVREALEKYISLKSNVLSPSTVTAYNRYLQAYPERLLKAEISRLTEEDIQSIVNELSASYSPKYTRNLYGLLSAVLGMFRPAFQPHVTLPRKRNEEQYIPTASDVSRVLEAAVGTNYEVPLLLASFGLRRGEICALTMDDIRDGEIRVNKAVAISPDGSYTVKEPKTASSTRTVKVPVEVTDLIHERGLYTGNPNSILRWLSRTQKRLDIPHFKLHAFRHFFASECHALGVPDAYVMKLGGWKTDNVLKSVYRHAQADISFDEIVGKFYSEKIFGTNLAQQKTDTSKTRII